METRIRISYPLYSLVNLAERRVIVKLLANGEGYIVLFTDRPRAEAWRARECPAADLWTISTRENLQLFLKGTMSDRTCRVTFDPNVSPGEKPPMLSIRGLLDRLQQQDGAHDGREGPV